MVLTDIDPGRIGEKGEGGPGGDGEMAVQRIHLLAWYKVQRSTKHSTCVLITK
jgi:hypothetical protein